MTGRPAGDDRLAAYQELANRHGLDAAPGEFEGEILIREQHAPAGRFALCHERPGAPIVNEDGRVIPVSRADAYLAAYAAGPDHTPGELYALTVARSPDAAASEHAFPLRRSDLAIDDAADRARETRTAHHLYRDGMALVSTPHEPGTEAYYTATPDGRWTGSPNPPGTGRFPPSAAQLRALTGDPSQAAAQPPNMPRPAADPEPAPTAGPAAAVPPEPAGIQPAAPPPGPLAPLGPPPGPVPPGPEGEAPSGDAGPVIERVSVLHGHVSPDTAYLIEDYPYGRRLRCQMRVWIDGPPDKGQYKGQYRVMRQTNDPKRDGPGRPGPFGQGEVGPGGHPWNAAKGGTYTGWLVLYLDGEGHVQAHDGSLIYGLSGPQDAQMRLDGTCDQLTPDERTIYDRMAEIGHRHDRWEPWHKALDFIRAYRAEHGTWPSQEGVRQAPGFYLDSHDYGVAIAAARDLPAPGQAAAGPASAAVGQDTAAPAAAQDATGSPAAAAGPAPAGAGPPAGAQDELAAERAAATPPAAPSAEPAQGPTGVIEGFTMFVASQGGRVCAGHEAHACVAGGHVVYEDEQGRFYCEAAARLAAQMAAEELAEQQAALRRTSRMQRPPQARLQPSWARNPRCLQLTRPASRRTGLQPDRTQRCSAATTLCQPAKQEQQSRACHPVLARPVRSRPPARLRPARAPVQVSARSLRKSRSGRQLGKPPAEPQSTAAPTMCTGPPRTGTRCAA